MRRYLITMMLAVASLMLVSCTVSTLLFADIKFTPLIVVVLGMTMGLVDFWTFRHTIRKWARNRRAEVVRVRQICGSGPFGRPFECVVYTKERNGERLRTRILIHERLLGLLPGSVKEKPPEPSPPNTT